MRAIFVNYPEPACGVAQFGRNLWAILRDSTRIHWQYCEPATLGEFRAIASMPCPDAVVYNWQSGQGGFLADAPFAWLSYKQYLCYHDNDINESAWAGIFFSDPTMTPRGLWHPIGRPLPEYRGKSFSEMANSPFPESKLVVGVHGFIGAWADQVVSKVINEFEHAAIRLNLPYATYGDADGSQARSMAERCRSMVANNSGITLEVSHDFLPIDQLLDWLASNAINVYIRPASWQWRGVSSAPDSAIAAKRPLAVNRCSAFRHLHSCSPSILVEDRSLMDIIGSGLSPTTKLRVDWSPEAIREQIESVLLRL